MLVLSQKKGESVQIGADITVTVLDVKSGKVRLGISAPRSAVVTRLQPGKETSAEDKDTAAAP